MNDEAQLVNLDNIDPRELRPEFSEVWEKCGSPCGVKQTHMISLGVFR